MLRPLLQHRERETVDGRARYLIELNPALRRSVTERWAALAAAMVEGRRAGHAHRRDAPGRWPRIG